MGRETGFAVVSVNSAQNAVPAYCVLEPNFSVLSRCMWRLAIALNTHHYRNSRAVTVFIIVTIISLFIVKFFDLNVADVEKVIHFNEESLCECTDVL